MKILSGPVAVGVLSVARILLSGDQHHQQCQRAEKGRQHLSRLNLTGSWDLRQSCLLSLLTTDNKILPGQNQMIINPGSP